MSSLLNSLDMSLDDLIAKKKSTNTATKGPREGRRSGGGSGGRGSGRGAPRTSRGGDRGSNKPGQVDRSSGPSRARRAPARGARKQATPYSTDRRVNRNKSSILSRLGEAKGLDGFKICVNNLKFDILESEIQELFNTVGKVISAEIKYDRSGRSTGTAYITFAKKAAADKALKEFNGRTLDGRPMEITSKIQSSNMNTKDVKKGIFGTALNRSGSGSRDDGFLGGRNQERSSSGNNNGRGRGGQGRGRRSNLISEDQLNSQMDDYMRDD